MSFSLEQLVESGQISAAEYHRRLTEDGGGEGGMEATAGRSQRAAVVGGGARHHPASSTMAVLPASGGRAVFTNVGVRPTPQPGKSWMRSR